MSLIGGGGWPQLVGVAVAYSVIQSLEGFVITPRVVGSAVGLRDVWVLLALFVGGELFGFLGVLLALPAAAVAKIFVARAMEHYRSTEFISRWTALASAARGDRTAAAHGALGAAGGRIVKARTDTAVVPLTPRTREGASLRLAVGAAPQRITVVLELQDGSVECERHAVSPQAHYLPCASDLVRCAW